jgi:prepilin-type N-terminal cleavage/methylation domain-containing protein
MNTIIHPKTRGRGFSLVEMSVSLVVVGVLGFMLWKFLPQFRAVDEARPVEAQIALADEAIVGFIMANHRLPCPDTDGDGLEEAPTPTGCAVSTGDLAFRTLGLSLPQRLRYGAYQTTGVGESSLTVAMERHTVPMPPVLPATTEWPLDGGSTSGSPSGSLDLGGAPGGSDDYWPSNPATNPVEALSSLSNLEGQLSRTDHGFTATRVNGLDFCAALREVQYAHSSGLTANGIDAAGAPYAVDVAYVVIHPGASDADGNGSFFDGTNDDGDEHFAAPSIASSNVYDDQVLAVGFSELAARLSCTSILSRANAAGHMARATYDHFLFALAYLQARAFLHDMALYDLQSAYSGLVLSVLNALDALAVGVMMTTAGAITMDEGVGTALFALTAIVTTASIGEAIAEMAVAIMGISDAIDGAADAGAARIEAEVYAKKMLAAANETARYAVELDMKGLLP